MRKRISVFTAVLLCLLVLSGCCFHREWSAATCDTPKTCVECGETEGDAPGHSWVDAACETPKTCSVCRLTEGDALGHNWVDATTEAPKTCTNCAATEGERIITDPRFTTAATRDIQGLWTADIPLTGEMLGLGEGYTDSLATIRIEMRFCNDGVLTVATATPDVSDFHEKLIALAVEATYALFESFDMDRATADEFWQEQFGMSVEDFCRSTFTEESVDSLIQDVCNGIASTGVYYIEDGILYSGESWDAEAVPETHTFNGNTLVLDSFSQTMGQDVIFTRVTE